ncbi:MAG: hypothetical protein IPH04_14440 [Saprospirales bacterium]|nr:hypothetical protein [Saprospirales bacterium]
MRTWYNGFALAANEIADGTISGNKDMVMVGATRMAGNISSYATAHAIELGILWGVGKAVPAAFGLMGNYMSKLFSGNTEDEDDERTQLLRLYQMAYAAKDWIVPIEIQDGNITSISISANHPFGDMQRTVNSLEYGWIKNDSWSQLAVHTLITLMGNLVEETILVNVAFQTQSGIDSYGNRIWEPGDDTDEKIEKCIRYAIKQAGPGFIGQFSRLGLFDFLPENARWGWLRKPSHAGDTMEEAVGLATGARPMVRNVYDIFKKALDDYIPAFAEEATQQFIFNDPKAYDTRISNADFEGQIRGMVEKESRYLRNLHDMYHLPVKYEVVDATQMQQIMIDEGLSSDESKVQGRLFHTIIDGKYRLPWNQIRKEVERRMANAGLDEPYTGLSKDTEEWLTEFERKANR